MTRIVVVVLVLAAAVGLGVVMVRQWSEISETTSTRSLENRAVPVAGRAVTCGELIPDGCGFDMQSAFDRWGGRLDSYVAADLGPWGRSVGVGQVVELGLTACNTASVPGNTFLEFLDAARPLQPDASSPQLFPLWDQARRQLCPEFG